MTISVGDVQFRGPYSKLAMLEHRPGVWAVLDGRAVPPLAVGGTEDVRRAVEDHPARACWSRRCDRPAVAVFYSPLPQQRERLVRKLRAAYELPCLSDGVTLPAPRTGAGAPVPVTVGEGPETDGDTRIA